MIVTATSNFILLSQSLTINKKDEEPGDGPLYELPLYKPGGRSAVSGVETAAAAAPDSGLSCLHDTGAGPERSAQTHGALIGQRVGGF